VDRGKCFIEYIPAEKAWVPIKADGYMYIDGCSYFYRVFSYDFG